MSEDPLAAARGGMIGLALAVVFFWTPLVVWLVLR
jgi:hypothetical protein